MRTGAGSQSALCPEHSHIRDQRREQLAGLQGTIVLWRGEDTVRQYAEAEGREVASRGRSSRDSSFFLPVLTWVLSEGGAGEWKSDHPSGAGGGNGGGVDLSEPAVTICLNYEGSQPGSGCVNSSVSYQVKSGAKFTRACLMAGSLPLPFPARLGCRPFTSMAGINTTPQPN